jgi:flagellar FliL protein
MIPSKKYVTLAIFALVTGIALSCQSASAADHGGGGASGAYIRIAPVTVNLLGGTQFVQTSISIKGRSADVANNVSTYMPIVRHELILLLSNQRSEDILTTDGKTALMEAIKHAVNKAINMDDQSGVGEVVIEDFIVQ